MDTELSRHVRNVVMDMDENVKHAPFYTCLTCSKARIKEVVIGPRKMKANGSEVKNIVVYRVTCRYFDEPFYLQRRQGGCHSGDANVPSNPNTCKSCKYGDRTEVVTVTSAGRKKKNSACKTIRTFYHCTNRQRCEQLKKENIHTMGYISCKFYEQGGDADEQNK